MACLASEVTEFSPGKKVVAGFLPGWMTTILDLTQVVHFAKHMVTSGQFVTRHCRHRSPRKEDGSSLPFAASKSGLQYVITTFSGLFWTGSITRCSFLKFVGGRLLDPMSI